MTSDQPAVPEGVPPHAWDAIGAVSDGKVWKIPERNATGEVIGTSIRSNTNEKWMRRGSKRGLMLSWPLDQYAGTRVDDPIFVVEGASDTAAGIGLSLDMVGRPSATGGVAHLVVLLKHRHICIIAENDQAGQDGARRVAKQLVKHCVSVRIISPPAEFKDLRAWVIGGGNLNDVTTAAKAAMPIESEEPSAKSEAAGSSESDDEGSTQAELLMRLALELYRFGRTTSDEPFAVPRNGPNIVVMFSKCPRVLMAALCKAYRARFGKVPNSNARADAILGLQGECLDASPEEVHLRLARHEGAVIIDMGRVDGQVISIKAGLWELLPKSPVLFRRTRLTSEMPIPERGGSLEEFRRLVNITAADWPLFLGWWVSAWYPGIPHCLMMLGGEQGTGKSTLARFAVQITDPSPAPLRCPPKNLDDWVVAASGSWAVVLDNLSDIPVWLADAICRAVTGEGLVKRSLFTDSELAVLVFRRVVIITSIDTGALRGDMADRLFIVDLERIDERRRLDDAELEEEFLRLRPRILGALLDLAAKVFAAMPSVKLTERPRMADFARVLGGVDVVLGTNSVEMFMQQAGRIADTVIEADPLAEALCRFAREVGSWDGTAGELYERITPSTRPADWPKGPKGMGGKLRRLAPVVRKVGVEVILPKPTDKRRRYGVRALQKERESTAPIAQQPTIADPAAPEGDLNRAVEDETTSNSPSNSPCENPFHGPENGHLGRLGDQGGRIPTLTEHVHGPPGDCYACGQRNWWSITDLMHWTCGGCHVPTKSNGDVIWWIGNRGRE